MKLTPLDIKKQEFKRSVRGYDRVEVDTFMELVAEEFDNLIQENKRLSKQTLTLEAELKHFKEVEKTLKETLYNVQETSQLSKENSIKEAALIKKEAELAASRMVDSARQEVHRLQEELTSLKQQKESFAARLRHLLGSQMELLEVLEMDDEKLAGLKTMKEKAPSAAKRSAARNSLTPAASKPVIHTETEDEEPRPTAPKNDDFFKDVFGDNLD